MKGLMTVQQAAKMLAVPEGTVRAWINRGNLNAVHLGRAVRVLRRDIDEAMRFGLVTAKGKA